MENYQVGSLRKLTGGGGEGEGTYARVNENLFSDNNTNHNV